MSLINDALKKAQSMKAAGAGSPLQLAQPPGAKTRSIAAASPSALPSSPPTLPEPSLPSPATLSPARSGPGAATVSSAIPFAAAPTAPTGLVLSPTTKVTGAKPAPAAPIAPPAPASNPVRLTDVTPGTTPAVVSLRRAGARQAQHNSTVLAVATGLLLTAVVVLGIALYVAFGRSGTATVVQNDLTADAPPEAPASTTAPAASATDPAAAGAPAPVSGAEPGTAPSPSLAPVAGSLASGEAAASPVSAGASEEPPKAPPAPDIPPPPPKRINRPVPAVQSWVEKIQITGVRRSERPKVLMNDRVYTIGETVNFEYDLKLAAVGERTLTFEDPLGNTYELRF